MTSVQQTASILDKGHSPYNVSSSSYQQHYKGLKNSALG
jgi:hypothetical protein